jgi:pimeloyl-ACP methyl ester carboxylesterase
MMIPCALAVSKTYSELNMPTVIVADEENRIIDFDLQSARLHDKIKQSRLHRLSGAGHMVHRSATSEVVADR